MSSPDPFAPIGGSGAATPAKRKAWSIITPVPDAPAPPAEHFKLGKPSVRWTYTDGTGAVLGYVLRFDTSDNEKEFRPLTLWRAPDGKPAWRWESWFPPKRPLYRLQPLADAPFASVIGRRRKSCRCCRAPSAGLWGGYESERQQECQ
jgi:putative DNA primase/helicase